MSESTNEMLSRIATSTTHAEIPESNLSPELMLHTFSFLTERESVETAADVCQGWKQTLSPQVVVNLAEDFGISLQQSDLAGMNCFSVEKHLNCLLINSAQRELGKRDLIDSHLYSTIDHDFIALFLDTFSTPLCQPSCRLREFA